MAETRITSEFAGLLGELKRRTGGSPHNLARALKNAPDTADIVSRLAAMARAIERHSETSSSRFIVQADPRFWRALKEYSTKWADTFWTMLDLQAAEAGEPTLDELLAEMRSHIISPDPISEEEDWHFDASIHWASALASSVEDYILNKAEDEPFFGRAAGALVWFRSTVGLDLEDVETRFRDFPVIVVPEHVSNRHGLYAERSLFAYLNDIRKSYVIGADLAAIALCRAATEIMIRTHYSDDQETKLSKLISMVQRQHAQLRPLNLLSKVNEANVLLHAQRQDISTEKRERILVREWVSALQELIAQAPQPQPVAK